MIQLHNSHFLRNLVYATTVVLLAMTVGCADDPLLSDRGGASKSPLFDVAIMSSWTDGMKVDRSSDGTRLSIDSIDNQSAGEQLYLITEQAALDDSVSCHATAMSRGSKIESLDKFPESFGLSAICYVGSSPTADYTTEFAHNIEIVKSGTLWEPKSHKMEWPGSGHIRFMAYAPYGHSDLKYSTADKPMLDFTVTTDIKKQIDLLTATVDCSGAGGSAVSLSFGHALSAITIKTGSEMLAGKVSKISISGIHRSGSLDMLTGKWTPKGDSATSFDIEFDPNNDYKENPGENDTKDDYPYTKPGSNIAGNGDDLTLFMIPQQLGENAALTMEFTDNLTGKQRTLTAKIGGKDKEWKAGNIYAYSLSTTGIVITPVVKLVKHGSTTDEFPFDSIPFSGSIRNVDLTAYVRVQQVGETTPKDLEYPVSIFSSADGGATWEQAVWEPNTPSEYPDYDGTPQSLKAMKTLTGSFHLQPQPVFKDMMPVFSTTTTERGSDKEWIDLSQINGETANCYMVNSPGYYCFPLVYGNGIKNGTDNKSAYTINRGPDTDTDKAEPGMLFFVDHLRRQITTPYIEDQVGAGNLDDAFILWQDSPGLLDLVEKSTVNGKSCIRFRVSRHSMVQGNAVIALRDKSGKIVWSWHIWVTDCKATDLFTTNSMPIPPETEGTQYRFLTRTLGYSNAHEGNPKRTIKLKFEFDLKDVDHKKRVWIKDYGQKEIIASLAGDNTYYQWGRKDAMVPGVYEEPLKHYVVWDGSDKNEFTMANKPVFDQREGYEFGRLETGTKGAYVDQVIRNPHLFVMGTKGARQHWHPASLIPNEYIKEGSMYNAWNTTARHPGGGQVISNINNQEVTKSIYDPCPPGFHVPASHAFTGMIGVEVREGSGYSSNRSHPENPVTWDEKTRSWNFSANADGKGSPIRLYATGMRDMNVSDTNMSKLPEYLMDKTWPAYSMITFICTATLLSKSSLQAQILNIDNRTLESDGGFITCGSCCGSNNSYGFTVWPVKDE